MKPTITCKIIAILFLFSTPYYLISQTDPDYPNILFILADDLGKDAINGYFPSERLPNTPTLDSLRNNGLTFDNAWVTPQCTPTRAAIMSGKYGIKTGVRRAPGNLDTTHQSIFKKIEELTGDVYADALIGKWHISNPSDFNHPAQHGLDHYEGNFRSGLDDYYSWEKVINNTTVQVDEYATSNLTTAAIDWINEQEKPWFLWLAHPAPHGPFQLPPDSLYTTTTDTSDNLGKYIAMIEAVDAEMNRLFKSMTKEELENTVVMFMGDNGTPRGVIQYYPNGQGKGTFYEAGLGVPFFVSGKGVPRKGERETALVHGVDLYATILEIIGQPLEGGIHNSRSFKHLLNCSEGSFRDFNYSDYINDGEDGYAIRNDQYKLVKYENGNEEFYDLLNDPQELNDLATNLTTEQLAVKQILEMEANQIRSDWSCNDGILNGDEVYIDACNDDCPNDNSTSTENIGCCLTPASPSIYLEYIVNGERGLYANSFPNHDYCFNNSQPSPIPFRYEIPKKPELADQITSILRGNGRAARFFGIAKNGVKFAPAPALPFVFENPNTGEYNWDWVFEPTNTQGPGMDRVSLDCASAHTNSNAGYHYHGNMFEYVETIKPGISSAENPPTTPLQVGWASDGFPILYRFGPDANHIMMELQPSYVLKTGLRPGDGVTAPCGGYSGRYTNDYEYLCGHGDLDECNGMESQIILQTGTGLDTFNYFYVVSATFPQIPRCLVGTPSSFFEQGSDPFSGPDADNDGYPDIVDCAPNNTNINPGATEIPGNGIDENCDGLDELAMIDEDGDGFYAENDCDDNNANIYPGATETCNGLDDNCDGNIDEGFSLTTYYQDADMDGFGNDDAPISGCVQPPSTSTVGGDCDDTNSDINPNGVEIPNNGIDEDCDGEDLTTSAFDLNGATVNIYPNPVVHNLTIETEISNEQLDIQILNNYGQLVLQSNTKIINLSNLNNGVYFLNVLEKSSGKRLIHKILKVQ
jgi:arylsulfatase A-like enzyme